MSARPQVFHEFGPASKGSLIRTRLVWKTTKTTRQMWSEFTNQEGDKDWHRLREVYRLTRTRSGRIRVETGEWGDPAEMGPKCVKRLGDDLRELSA